MTERRVVVLAFFAFLAVGAIAILVFASQPVSHPSIQSGRGAETTRPHRATTSPTTPGTLPQPPTEVKGESATSATAKPAPTAAPPTTAPRTAAPLTAAPLTAAPPTAAAPTATAPTAALPTTAPPTTAPRPTAAPTTTPPTTAPPTTNKEKPLPPGQAKK